MLYRRTGNEMKKTAEKIRQYRFLFEELVRRDFIKKYKQTLLGVGWSVLNPLLTLLVMSIVFSQFFGRSVEHYTIYLFCGNLVFSYFRESTEQGMTSLVDNAPIYTKINVPKYMFILSKNTQTLLNFCISFAVFFLFCLFDNIQFSWKFLYLLYPIVCLMIFNIGIGMILSALYVFFRDMQYLWSVATLLIMYMSAIFYTTDGYSAAVQHLFLLNPVYVYITYFRLIVIQGTVPGFWIQILSALYAAAALFIGLLIYKKKNHEFLYYV